MLHVAVIDDNPLVLESLTTTIDWSALDCMVVGAAGNGDDARALLSQKRVDIIISDIKMPRMDGLELAGWVAQIGIHAKIILITGFQEFELAQQALRLGVFDLLCKPLMNSDICRVVRKAIAALQEEREHNPRLLPSRAPEGASPLVRRVIACMEREYSKDIRLEEMATKFHVSPSHLSRAVKKDTGQGFVETLTDIRLDAAVQLLKQPGAMVSAVALQVGYSDYPYFYQVFKKRFGVSPKEYCKKHL